MLMFSVNPMYDYGQGRYANGSSEERSQLYRRCEKEGVGISVMKPFSAGQLLDALPLPCRSDGADAEDPGIFRKIDLLSDFMNSRGITISN